MKREILGYQVEGSRLDACVEALARALDEPTRRWLACLNPHSYVVALQDDAFARALRDADWLLPDGVGVVIAARVLGRDVPERVTGPDVFLALHARLDRERPGTRVFFLGGTEDTLTRIEARMKADHPRLVVAGTYSPPFRPAWSDAEIDEMVRLVNAARPDLLWVGLTAPKQEKWIHETLPRLEVRVAGAVGAVFDFYAGTVKRSPVVFRRLGLEWLPRLAQQPRRLWRRMGHSAPVFLWHVARARFGLPPRAGDGT